MVQAPFYLGSLGAMVALPGIQNDQSVDANVDRYGGIRQSLNGTSTLDVLAHKRAYSFKWEWLLPDEAVYLDRLSWGLVPGPLRLLDPTRVNRLPVHSATSGSDTGIVTDFTATTGTRSWVAITDPPATVPVSGVVSWVRSTTAVSQLQAPLTLTRRVPVLPGETVRISVYVRALSTATTVQPGLLTYTAGGTSAASVGGTVALSASATWTRLVMSYTQSSTTVGIVPLVGAPAGAVASTVQITGWQVESGAVETAWAFGGGAPAVLATSSGITYQTPTETAHSLELIEA